MFDVFFHFHLQNRPVDATGVGRKKHRASIRAKRVKTWTVTRRTATFRGDNNLSERASESFFSKPGLLCRLRNAVAGFQPSIASVWHSATWPGLGKERLETNTVQRSQRTLRTLRTAPCSIFSPRPAPRCRDSRRRGELFGSSGTGSSFGSGYSARLAKLGKT